MKRFLIFVGFLAALCACAPAHAQIYDTQCPAGSSVAPGGQTRNPSDDHIKQNYCTDSTGSPIINGPFEAIGPCTGSGCGSGSGGAGTAFNVTNSAYGAVADGSTDNSTAFATVFAASNAITKGIPTVYFPCEAGKQCQYNYSDGGSTSPINPTIPTTIQCDPGVILNDTGSAHMIDAGMTSAGQYLPYRITGCFFKGSGVTAGVFINSGTTTPEFNEGGYIDHNYFYDLPFGSSAVTGTGNIYNWYIDLNTCINDVDNAGNCINIPKGPGGSFDNIIFATNNQIFCASGSPPSVANCTNAGVGIYVGGEGSVVTGNVIVAMKPDVQVSHFGTASVIANNNLENIAATGTLPAIVFGDSSDSSSTYIEAVVVRDNAIAMHTAAPAIAPATTNDLMVNWNVHSNTVTGFPTVLAKLNNSTGQTGNRSSTNLCGSNFVTTPGTPCILHTMTGNSVNPENWINLDYQNFGDGFNRANGAINIGVPAWITAFSLAMPSITSNSVPGGAAIGAIYSSDLPNNQRIGIRFLTVPTGIDDAYVYARAQDSAATANTYLCGYISGTGIKLEKIVANTTTQLGSTYTTTTPAVGSLLELEAIGSVITCYLNNVPVAFASDSSLTFGYGGFEMDGSGTGSLSGFTAKGLP